MTADVTNYASTCEARQQPQYHKTDAVDLEPLRRGATVRTKAASAWQARVADEVETPRGVARRNRVYLRRTNEPSPSLSDSEISVQDSPQYGESQSSVPGIKRKHRQEEVSAKQMLRRSEGIRRPPKYLENFKDLIEFMFSYHFKYTTITRRDENILFRTFRKGVIVARTDNSHNRMYSTSIVEPKRPSNGLNTRTEFVLLPNVPCAFLVKSIVSSRSFHLLLQQSCNMLSTMLLPKCTRACC